MKVEFAAIGFGLSPRRLLGALAALSCLALPGTSSAQTAAPATPNAAACTDAERLAAPDVRILATLPAEGYCRVQGVIEKEIGFELWLPAQGAWNGRFLAAGVGGQAGQVNRAELARVVRRGYAAASTDAGHTAADRHWLLNSPERALNYAERANHLLAVKGKALTAAYYGRWANRAFFLGCSGGGRQAMTELQRFPDDYDGIIAGAPGVNTPEMSARRLWEMTQHSANAGLMTQADWGFVAKAAVAECDANDGVKDGVVADPMRCGFRPAHVRCRPGQTGQCLSGAQVALAEKLYAPLHDEKGRLIDDGLLPGVEVQQAPVPEPYTPGPAYLATVLFGDGVHHDANWDAHTFNISRDLPAVDKVLNLHADDPDVDRFIKRGGKLIMFQGLADPLVSPQSTVAYYDALQRRYGVARSRGFARLFLAPGMGHCRGGDTPDVFGQGGVDAPVVDASHDMLSALEAWVDKGAAPETLIASRVEAGKVSQTRPLCAYPLQARYRGTGDTNDAANFSCAAAQKRKRTG